MITKLGVQKEFIEKQAELSGLLQPTLDAMNMFPRVRSFVCLV